MASDICDRSCGVDFSSSLGLGEINPLRVCSACGLGLSTSFMPMGLLFGGSADGCKAGDAIDLPFAASA